MTHVDVSLPTNDRICLGVTQHLLPPMEELHRLCCLQPASLSLGIPEQCCSLNSLLTSNSSSKPLSLIWLVTTSLWSSQSAQPLFFVTGDLTGARQILTENIVKLCFR